MTMAKLRHVAMFVEDPDKTAKFFEEAFDMTLAQKTKTVRFMTDGTVNVALIQHRPGETKLGLDHFGMWVDDIEEAKAKAERAGATFEEGPPRVSGRYYEIKYISPDGTTFDLSPTGWVGAVRDVVPAGDAEPVSAR